MNTSFKYDPEDIESLLMHKQFHELYPEEKEFVLRHVENADEYESLRHTFFLMRDMADGDEWLEPDPSIKRRLMREFATERRSGFLVWLNSLFAMPSGGQVAWHRRPAVRYAFATVVLLIGISGALFVFNGKDNTMADATPAKQDTVQAASAQDKPAYAENLRPNVFPPAPQPLEESGKVTEAEVIDFALPTSPEGALELKTEEYAAMDQAEPAIPPAFLSTDLNEDVSIAATSAESDREDLMEKATAVARDDMTKDKKAITVTSVAPDSSVVQMTSPVLTSATISSGTTNSYANSHSNVAVMTEAASLLFDIDSNVNLRVAASSSAAEMRDVLDILFTAQ